MHFVSTLMFSIQPITEGVFEYLDRNDYAGLVKAFRGNITTIIHRTPKSTKFNRSRASCSCCLVASASIFGLKGGHFQDSLSC